MFLINIDNYIIICYNRKIVNKRGIEMKKICIFNLNKVCNDCGECMICDLNRNKTCDNCEKCLDLDKNDLKEVIIDEILDDTNELFEIEMKDSKEIDPNREWELIDDIKNLKELVVEVQQGGDSKKTGYHEEYPGLILKNGNE